MIEHMLPRMFKMYKRLPTVYKNKLASNTIPNLCGTIVRTFRKFLMTYNNIPK